MLSTAYLLSVAVISVAILLILIIWLRFHAFIALMIVSVLTAIAAGVRLDNLLSVLLEGFSNTLANIAILVAFGAMIGRLLEASGGAAVLASTMIYRLGESRAKLALGIASLLFALPMFFDVGLIVMLPVVFSVAKRLKISALECALPCVGAFSVMHVFTLPHPGPLAASVILGANVGELVLFGLILACITWFLVAYLLAPRLSRGIVCSLIEPSERALPDKVPSFSTVLFILLVPVVLIFFSASLEALIHIKALADSAFVRFFIFLGSAQIALLITLLFTLFATRNSFEPKRICAFCDESLAPISSVVLVTAAGGMFGHVLQASQIGNAIASSLSDIGINVIISGFVIAAALRIAQGSATVALSTAAALISPLVGDLSSLQLSCVVLAIASGSVICSHFNDSGFWLIKGLLNLDEISTLKTWTILESLISLVAFGLISLVWVCL